MRETVFENGLRVPVEVNEIFDAVLEPYTSAEVTGVRGDVAPFLTRDEFDDVMMSINEVREAVNSVAKNDEDRDRVLSHIWADLPSWAKSREAFQQRWQLRVIDPRVSLSPGYVRGRVEEVLAALEAMQEPEPAMAFGMR
ncbi:hypothetical protein [Mesorhizobium sp. A623]